MKKRSFAQFVALGVIFVLQGCGTLALDPVVTQGTVSFDRATFPQDFFFTDIDGSMASRTERDINAKAARLMKAKKFNTGDLVLGVLRRHTKISGVFKAVVDANSDYIFRATELRNSLTIPQKTPGMAYAEAHFGLVLVDKLGKKVWTTTVWIDEYDKPGKVMVSDTRRHAGRVQAALQISTEEAGKELGKQLKEALEKGQKEAAKQ
ncbi:MAG: hypothetical protein ACYTFG_03550 [Planctomycetota bacterium]